MTPGIGRLASRYPVRHQTDGDFSIAEILAHAGPPAAIDAALQPIAAEVALHARLWQLDSTSALAVEAVSSVTTGVSPGPATAMRYVVQPADIALLHAFETAPLWTPPVATHTAALTSATAQEWLALAAQWTRVSSATDDLRFLNAACKLLGAVWNRYGLPTGEHADNRRLAESGLMGPIAEVANFIGLVSARLAQRLNNRLLPRAAADLSGDERIRHLRCVALGDSPVIIVLAGAGSESASSFIAASAAAGVPITGLCWYGPGRAHREIKSSYADAWYPPSSESPSNPSLLLPHLRQVTAQTWQDVAEMLQSCQADLVILMGMPIVPPRVLTLARLGFLNAHNGALPQYRGMDAVAWALLNNDPIICSLHIARPAVDSGEVIATAPISFEPAGTLRARVKAAQLHLLLSAAAFAAENGKLPDATRQPTNAGRQHYRLHPHLKRLLDDSPYATPADRMEGAHH